MPEDDALGRAAPRGTGADFRASHALSGGVSGEREKNERPTPCAAGMRHADVANRIVFARWGGCRKVFYIRALADQAPILRRAFARQPSFARRSGLREGGRATARRRERAGRANKGAMRRPEPFAPGATDRQCQTAVPRIVVRGQARALQAGAAPIIGTFSGDVKRGAGGEGKREASRFSRYLSSLRRRLFFRILLLACTIFLIGIFLTNAIGVFAQLNAFLRTAALGLRLTFKTRNITGGKIADPFVFIG